MQSISNEERKTIEEGLLKRKLRSLLGWNKPVIKEVPGPFEPTAFDRYDERVTAVVESCRAFLESLSHEEIHILIEDGDVSEELENQWVNLQTYEIQNLINTEPEWSSGGLGHPAFAADFEYWINMERYTLHECLFLSVGLDPRSINERTFKSIVERKSASKRTAAISYLVDRYELFDRKFRYSIDAQGPVTPKFLLGWFEEVPMNVSADFLEALRRRVQPVARVSKNDLGSNLSGQERQTALKLIAAMSAEQYDYNPDNQRNQATANVQSDLNSIGHQLDDKTIRKWLREASELIDEDYWKK